LFPLSLFSLVLQKHSLGKKERKKEQLNSGDSYTREGEKKKKSAKNERNEEQPQNSKNFEKKEGPKKGTSKERPLVDSVFTLFQHVCSRFRNLQNLSFVGLLFSSLNDDTL
jgi:hypothetical protein